MMEFLFAVQGRVIYHPFCHQALDISFGVAELLIYQRILLFQHSMSNDRHPQPYPRS